MQVATAKAIRNTITSPFMRFLLALTDLRGAVFAPTPKNGIPRYKGHASDLRKAIRAKKKISPRHYRSG
jgi:hypothetical protein